MKNKSLIYFYAITMLFFYLGDSIMSYASPVVMENHTNRVWLMGLIFSFSSVIGFICDLLFAKWFSKQGYHFFAKFMFYLVSFFPLSFLLFPASTWSFLFAMAVWGVYYELTRFTHFNFIKRFIEHDEHSQAWDVINLFQTIAIIIGPIIASFAYARGERWPFIAALGTFLGSFLIYQFLIKKINQNHREPVTDKKEEEKRTTDQTLAIWWTLIKKVWPLYLFLFSLIVSESAFWTIGSLLSEDLKKIHWTGGLLLPMYSSASLLSVFLVDKFCGQMSKKRVALVSALIGGIILGIACLFFNGLILLGLVFLASAFISVAYPKIYAVFEDYVARLGLFRNDMIGIQGSAISLGYVAGPIIASVLATFISSQATLGYLAFFLSFVSGITLLIIPRKIKMPQQELQEINEEK